jgi:ribonuclease VapC
LVVDTSILLAVVFNETHGPWCVKQLQDHAAALMMSTVNYAELLILISDRQPKLAAQLRDQISALPIRFVAPSVQQAEIAAEARLNFPLNLGDSFAYALAKEQNCGLLTLDRDFRKTDLFVLTASAK